MRKIIFESSISIDGFIEGPNGELDWMVSEKEMRGAGDLTSVFDTIFYGRKTYEKLAASSPMAPDLPKAERTRFFSLCGMRKYVFSRTRRHVEGNGMVISDNIEAEVKRIREEEGKNILCRGGAGLLKTFADLDLIDAYLLLIHPVILGRGKYLFASGRTPGNLNLVNKRKLESGVVMLHYLPESRFKYQCP